MDYKECTKCKETYPATEKYFYKQKTNTKSKGIVYKLSSWCKECSKKNSTKNYIDNREDRMLYRRRHYKENTEYYKKATKEYKHENKEYYKENLRQWQQNNKEKLKQYRLKRESNKIHEISEGEWTACKEYFDYECAYCGLPEDEHKKIHNQQLHREHVDHEGSNKLDNCVPSCRSCNGSKREYDIEEWYNESNENYKIERLNKIRKWLNEDWLKIVNNTN